MARGRNAEPNASPASHPSSDDSSTVKVLTPDYSSDSSADNQHLARRRQSAATGRGVKLIPRASSHKEARRLTRQCQIRPATTFQPADPALTPELHFPSQTLTSRTSYPRFVNRFNSREMMLVVDGSCVNNGAGVGKKPPVVDDNKGRDPSAAASFIYRNNPGYVLGPHATTMPFLAVEQSSRGDGGAALGDITIPMPDITGKIALQLEQQGPRGDVARHTSNRAKLRAVIAALDWRPWHGEGWERIIIVTDLEYVVLGATKWLPVWAKRRWRSAPGRLSNGRVRIGKKIANRDLWEELQSRIETLRADGSEVAFWLVPPKSPISRDSALLKEVKSAAREAARSKSGPVVEEYTKLCGLFV